MSWYDGKPFYANGLRFECKKDCSRCCGGAPGYVWITEKEVLSIAEFMKISVEEFVEGYTKTVMDRLSLLDLEDENWNCVMLKDGKCSIYEGRPRQCRTYPFWPNNLVSEETWEDEKIECPGIGKGRFFSRAEIDSIAMGNDTIDSVK